jgi:folate-binding protein YgfZ
MGMAEQTPFFEVETAAGASFTEDGGWSVPVHFGNALSEYQHARQRAAFFDRSHHGKIEVSGKDARTFLHNLCTNDLKNLPQAGACEAFFATNKAKAIAYVSIYHRPAENSERFWIDAGPGLGPKLYQHLDRYLISEQVEITDRTAEFTQVHLAGPEAEGLVSKVRERLPEVTVLRPHNPLGLPGFDLLVVRAKAAELWQVLLSLQVQPAGLDAYELLRVESGTPIYGKDIDDERFVVEVHRIPQTISYTKGCYLGQEPIVMARDRGHVNRKLLGVKIGGGDAVPRGVKLLHAEAEAGQVTSSVVSPRFGPIALAYIRRGHDSPGTKLQVEGTGLTAEVVGLPFAGSGDAAP